MYIKLIVKKIKMCWIFAKNQEFTKKKKQNMNMTLYHIISVNFEF